MSFIHSDTEFFKSSYSVGHIIVKPILFVTAQSLMGYFITGLCSLIAAHANQFTAHLMFTENAIQRVLFLKSRRISWPSVLVLFYSILNFFVIIYDSFLWALDNPGAIIPKSHAILSEHLHDLSWDRTYVIPLRLGMGYIYSSDPDTSLAYALGGDLFWPGAGIFITSVVDRGMPSTAEHLQPSLVQQFGPRIWLDETGFSVSCDTSASFPSVVSLPDSNEAFPLTCSDFSNATGRWNCSFPNAFAPYFLERIQGLPEVHWGSSKYSSYVLPNPSDNLWYTAGKGTGTMGMIQVFTITKGKRRHTFVETCFRITMTTRPGVDFDTDDVSDLMLRASSLDEQTISEDLLGMVLHDISAAQQRNESYTFGLAKSRGPYTVLQNSWSYFTGLSPSYTPHVMSVVHITSTNITLLRSEDIPDPPSPHNTNCEEPYHNQAFGGKVTHTSCTKLSPTFEQSNSNPDSDLFTGTIDTSAVTLLQNIGSPTSQTSSGSLNFYSTWLPHALPKIVSLLIARAYAVSIDPSLVQVSVQRDAVDALSGLQILLIALPFLLAILTWTEFRLGWTTGRGNPPLDPAWTRSVWGNVVQMTKYRGTEEGERLYVRKPPEVELVDDENGKGKYMRLDGEPLWLGPAQVGLEAVVAKEIQGDEDQGGWGLRKGWKYDG